MNKEYNYVDDKVIVKNQNGEVSIREYSDNINEILEQENLVEIIDERLSALSKESDKFKSKRKFVPLALYSTLFGLALIIPLMMGIYSGINPYLITVDTIYGPINGVLLMTAFCSIFAIPLSTFLTYIDYSNYKKRNNHKNAIDTEIEYLTLKLDKETNKLNELNNDKNVSNHSINTYINQINDLETLRKLRSYTEMYYDLGYNEKKYLKYLNKGTLQKDLNIYYNDEQIESAKEYLNSKKFNLKKGNNKKRTY